jgi:hypothetical protein
MVIIRRQHVGTRPEPAWTLTIWLANAIDRLLSLNKIRARRHRGSVAARVSIKEQP